MTIDYLINQIKNKKINNIIIYNGLELTTNYGLNNILQLTYNLNNDNIEYDNRINIVELIDYYPIIGNHLKNVNQALFYISSNVQGLSHYRQMIQSLKNTNFHGDIVLTLLPNELENEDYINYFKQENIIVYSYKLNCISSEKCLLDYPQRPSSFKRRPISQINTLIFEYWTQFYSDKTQIVILSEISNVYFKENIFEIITSTFQSSSNSLGLFQSKTTINSKLLSEQNQYISSCISQTNLNILNSKPLIRDNYFIGTKSSLKSLFSLLRIILMSHIPCWTSAVHSQQALLSYLYYSEYFKPTEAQSLVNPLIVSSEFLPELKNRQSSCIFNYQPSPQETSSIFASNSNFTINLTPPNRRGKLIKRPRKPKGY